MPLTESVPSLSRNGTVCIGVTAALRGKEVCSESLNHPKVGRNYKVNFPTTCQYSNFFCRFKAYSRKVLEGVVCFLRSLRLACSVLFFFFFVTTI